MCLKEMEMKWLQSKEEVARRCGGGVADVAEGY